tara:strand:+ start:36498 stop:36932 length:435 start_codon:yes stop_codon:yes gene_type:complete
MSTNPEILKRIPQKDPFLFISDIIEQGEDKIITNYQISGNEDFFKGHFPHMPIMPGVLLCEAAFQTGALLMSYKFETGLDGKTAVVSRVNNAKFKNLVRPGDNLIIEVELTEQIENAAFMKGKITVDKKKALLIDFAVTLVENP